MSSDFDWERVPEQVLDALRAGLYELDAEDEGWERDGLARLLNEDYGTPPGEEFAKDAWWVLLDHWLPDAAEARHELVNTLWKPRMGPLPTTKHDELEFLLARNISKGLRVAVLEQVLPLGMSAVERTADDGPRLASRPVDTTRATTIRKPAKKPESARLLEATLWEAANRLRFGLPFPAHHGHRAPGLVVDDDDPPAGPRGGSVRSIV